MTTTHEMLEFLEESPSPYHCVAACARRLQSAGFRAVDEQAEPGAIEPGQGGFVARAGTLIAWRAGTAAPAAAGFRMLGAHTDSPNLRIKPRPNVVNAGYRQWGVEKYGGVLLATWPDRDLGIAGRVFIKDGDDVSEKLVRIDRPIARVPNLAIHLNRGVNKEGYILDPQKHLPPLISVDTEGGVEFQDVIARAADVDKATIVSWDIGLYDIQKPCLGGLDDEFVFSARLDNQASCYQALATMLSTTAAPFTQMIVLFDHEEVGSRSAQGAMGAFLRDILVRIERDHKEQQKGGLERALANSWLVSMDMAHGVHPNYFTEHEPNHMPMMNGGPVIKEHVEQRYATDGETSAFFRMACERADVPCQDFVIRTDMACGSTIGPIASAQLGVRTVDVGNAMLSMHSIREQCGAKDTEMMIEALRQVFTS